MAKRDLKEARIFPISEKNDARLHAITHQVFQLFQIFLQNLGANEKNIRGVFPQRVHQPLRIVAFSKNLNIVVIRDYTPQA
jgi:hypothetical protein